MEAKTYQEGPHFQDVSPGPQVPRAPQARSGAPDASLPGGRDRAGHPRAPEAPALLRVADLLLVTFLLLLLFPLSLFLALWVRLDSPGPILFTQRRVGKDGKEFDFYKFRSMVADAEKMRASLEARNERDGPVFKMKDDPRVTRVGRFLRRSSLDELPQLLNVLRGEMSLVGPRPALPREVAQYTPRERERLAVTPGLTGLWQVSGRASLGFDRSLELDLFYIRHRSLGLYLKILCMTLPAVLRGDGAY